ncbi:GGDEF domain-containing protein [bacterium]|nr:GGDEF domain-containing protein [bacterium]
MLEKLDRYFSHNRGIFNILYSAAFIFLIGLADYVTGREVVLSVFYAVPLVFIAWYSRFTTALVMAILTAIIWFLANYLDGTAYPHWAIPYWNSLVRLSFQLMLIFLTTKLKNALQFEKSLARVDSLTRLANGRGFQELAMLELQRSSRAGRPFTVAYVDLDNFKYINDTFGHDKGDALLIEVATIFRKSLRTIDQAARLGGDEFALLMPETDLDAAKVVITKVREALQTAMQQKQWPVTASIGVLTFDVPPASVNAMIKMVDDLMYTVKKSGKNNATFHSYRPSVVAV